MRSKYFAAPEVHQSEKPGRGYSEIDVEAPLDELRVEGANEQLENDPPRCPLLVPPSGTNKTGAEADESLGALSEETCAVRFNKTCAVRLEWCACIIIPALFIIFNCAYWPWLMRKSG